jgi:hypothetical protein
VAVAQVRPGGAAPDWRSPSCSHGRHARLCAAVVGRPRRPCAACGRAPPSMCFVNQPLITPTQPRFTASLLNWAHPFNSMGSLPAPPWQQIWREAGQRQPLPPQLLQVQSAGLPRQKNCGAGCGVGGGAVDAVQGVHMRAACDCPCCALVRPTRAAGWTCGRQPELMYIITAGLG